MLTPEWRGRLGKGAALVGLLLCAFAFGRFGARGPDIQEDSHVEHTTTTVTKTRVVYERERDTHQDRVVRRDFRPDGTLQVETERTVTDEHEHERSEKTGDVREDEHATASASRSVTTHLPDWRLGARVGAAAQLGPNPSVGLEVGLQAERRLLGPISGGVYLSVRPGTSLGLSGGALISIEF